MEPTDEAWHYAIGRQQHGPVSLDRLRDLVRDGTLSADTLVWKHGMDDWARIGRLPELANLGAAPPTLPGEIRRPQPADTDLGTRMLLPVGRSGWAIASGYLGLLSPLLVFAPLAIITGFVAIYDIKKHPTRHGMGRAVFGIGMGALCVIGYAVLIL